LPATIFHFFTFSRFRDRSSSRGAGQLSGRSWHEHPRAAQLIEPSGCVI
jgi:hypothetical protein